MQHLNGHLMCVIDTETTGLDPTYNEIWQICILPLDSNLEPNQDYLPFYIKLKPEHPEYIDWDVRVFKKNKKKIVDAITTGYDQLAAIDLLKEWVERLKLPVTKFGTPKKIEPLGQNYGFDKSFIQQWLTVDVYNELFDYHHRDTMSTALFLNDHASFHAEKVPFSKVNLKWLGNKLGVRNDDAHDALADCVATAECYRIMCSSGVFNPRVL